MSKISSITTFVLLQILLTADVWAATLPKDYNQKVSAMAELSKSFESNEVYYTSSKYQEEDVRKDFIDKFFIILGWDVENDNQALLYAQDSIPEARLKVYQTTKFVDYAFRINGRNILFVEAKAPSKDIDDPDYIFQAKRYAWSSGHTDVAILTGYKDFRVYDARIKPDYYKPQEGELKQFRMSYKDYPKQFKLLWNTFSKQAVLEGSLRKLLANVNKDLEKIPMQDNLVKELEILKLKLAQDIFDNNKGLSDEELSEASQNILNKILFARILEDRDITTTKRMFYALADFEQDKSLSMEDKGGHYLKAEKLKPAVQTLFEELKKEFNDLAKRYNGVIFAPHMSDNLEISDSILKEVITELYGTKSAYDFSVVPVHVIGKAYENSLGKTLSVADGKVIMKDRPEVRSSGGVFYTPEWVARYMVEETMGKRLQGADISILKEIKILDPACGSGVFPATVAEKLFKFAEDYYNKNPDKIGGTQEFPDAIKLDSGYYVLSAPKRAEIINDAIYCSDIDEKAVENTKMWLYIQMLEYSGSYIAEQEREYKIPNKISLDKAEKFALPSLDENIVVANSLIGTDSGSTEENAKTKAFDWNTGKIGEIVKDGGFDIVIGNPPYIRPEKAKDTTPKEHEYIKKQYNAMHGRNANLFFAFFEKGLELAKEDGDLSYITSNSILLAKAAETLRKQIKPYVSKIINFGNNRVFDDASTSSVITFLKKTPGRATFDYTRFPDKIVVDMSDKTFAETMNRRLLDRESWNFPVKSQINNIEAMFNHHKKLKDYAKTMTGISTGKNEILIIDDSKIGNFEKPCLRPIVLTKDIHRYTAIKPVRHFVYAYEDGKMMTENDFSRKCPNLYGYLLGHKQELLKRSNTNENNWYAVRVGSHDEKGLPKIMMGWKKGKQPFTIDFNGDIFSGGGTSVLTGNKISLEALLGILNSQLLSEYFQYASPFLIGGAPKHPANVINEIPIPEYTAQNAPIYKEIEERVKMIYKLREMPNSDRLINNLEKEIDALVYRLYGIETNVSFFFRKLDNLIEYNLAIQEAA